MWFQVLTAVKMKIYFWVMMCELKGRRWSSIGLFMPSIHTTLKGNMYLYYSTFDRFQKHGLITRRSISYLKCSYIKCNRSI
jgi:hypothetical protein